MFTNFGIGKCPVCGDFGKEMHKRIFHCGKCRVSFNEFSISAHEDLEEYSSKYLN